MATVENAEQTNPLTALRGEIPLKSWKWAEAERLGTSFHAVEMRLHRGKYPNLKLRRVTKRTIYVSEASK